jgi:hypothetical protein
MIDCSYHQEQENFPRAAKHRSVVDELHSMFVFGEFERFLVEEL